MMKTRENLMHQSKPQSKKQNWRNSLLFLTFITCNTSYAEVIIQQNPSSNASIAWSDAQVGQFMSDELPAAQVTVEVKRSEVPKSSSPIVLNNSTLAQKYPTTTSHYATTSYRSSSSPLINARSAIVMDAQTGEVLFGKNATAPQSIASITKLMTAVVTADAHLDMAEKITLQQIDFAGAGGKNSSSTLRAGDVMNRAELLLAALMKSENPAAAALARTYPGGRTAFFAAMNNKARQLGMHATHYMESTGLHPGNVSSAQDLAILVSSAAQYGLIRQFSTTPSYDFNLGYRVLKANNTNALVRNGGWNINLSKTGYINEAGRCVVMEATVNQRPAVIVLLGASSTAERNNDATNLLTWLSSGIKAI